MVTVLVRFPAGRYHATPFGHHVNEGQVEWPPSPWRILRALIACGYATQHWEAIPPLAVSLLMKLADRLPSYRLPAVTEAHTRHYMPTGSLKDGRERTSLVFDTWVNTGSEAVTIRWDCELIASERELLATLLSCLNYMGRGESWVEAELLPEGLIENEVWDAFPGQSGLRPGAEWEQIRLMAAVPAGEYLAWRTAAVENALAAFQLPVGSARPAKKLMQERAKVMAAYPETLLDCLGKDTAWWKEFRWPEPLGARKVPYWRRLDGGAVTTGGGMRIPGAERVEAMLLALTTPSGSRTALPPVTRTLPQAELFHRAIVGLAAKGGRVLCPELTGCDEDGERLRGPHEHAHVLPLDLDGDGRLDHVLVHAPMGLGGAAQEAIRSLRRTWTKGGAGEIQLAVAACGPLSLLRDLPAPFRESVHRLLGPSGGARRWRSATPFVPPRFLKPRGRNALAGQVNAELRSRGFAEAQSIELDAVTPDTLVMRHFIRRRQHGGAPPPVDRPYFLRLSFAEPVAGPLCVGYGSHYGLGLLLAEPEQ